MDYNSGTGTLITGGDAGFHWGNAVAFAGIMGGIGFGIAAAPTSIIATGILASGLMAGNENVTILYQDFINLSIASQQANAFDNQAGWVSLMAYDISPLVSTDAATWSLSNFGGLPTTYTGTATGQYGYNGNFASSIAGGAPLLVNINHHNNAGVDPNGFSGSSTLPPEHGSSQHQVEVFGGGHWGT